MKPLEGQTTCQSSSVMLPGVITRTSPERSSTEAVTEVGGGAAITVTKVNATPDVRKDSWTGDDLPHESFTVAALPSHVIAHRGGTS